MLKRYLWSLVAADTSCNYSDAFFFLNLFDFVKYFRRYCYVLQKSRNKIPVRKPISSYV